MWQAIIGFVGGPVVKGLLDAYKEKLKAGTADNKVAADLAASDMAAQTQIKIAEIGHPFEPEKLAFYVVLIHLAKCVIWDTVLGFGSTPVLKGEVAAWEGMIMGFYFTKRGIENVARYIWR